MTRMQQRGYPAATWASSDVPLDREIAIETDTGKWKIGDGTSTWAALPYQPYTAGITDQITTAVNALINGAPGALNTLNELATALGDDANFASTVTGLIAAKAPIDSPTFTGTVSGITAAMVGADTAGVATAAQAFSIQRSNHTGTQPASTITGLAPVATSGAYADLTGTPTVGTAAAHAATDFDSAGTATAAVAAVTAIDGGTATTP